MLSLASYAVQCIIETMPMCGPSGHVMPLRFRLQPQERPLDASRTELPESISAANSVYHNYKHKQKCQRDEQY